MSIYDTNGNVLSEAYASDGSYLSTAYDSSGNPIWSANPITLKIMTYNCGQWLTGTGAGTSTEDTNAVNHRTLLESILTAQDPDILVIQEYWSVIGSTSIISMLSESYPYYQEVNRRTVYFGHAIYSKYPISNFVTTALSSTINFQPVSESSNTNRYIDRCNITVDDTVLTVFNTHFGLSESVRSDNADWLLPLLNAQTNVIACGDYNTSCLSASDADYTGVIAKFLSARYHCANCSTFGFIKTWTDSTSSMTDGIPTDNIITSSNIIINDAYADETKLNDELSEKIDHLPFVAEISVF